MIVERVGSAEDNPMLPEIITSVPGEKSLALGRRLAEVECRNTTFLDQDWPIFWERAEGSNVWDVDGRSHWYSSGSVNWKKDLS